MKNFFHILAILAVFVLQLTLVPHLQIAGSQLNLFLVIILCLIFVTDFPYALLWVGAGGILMDLASPYYFGLYTLEFATVFIIASYLVFKIFHRPNILVAFSFLFVFTLFYDIIFALLAHTGLHLIFLANGLYNGLLGIGIFALLKRYLPTEEKIKV